MSKLKTSCKDCFYAKYDSKDKKQIGCHFGRLQKLRSAGIDIQEAYDEEKEFFVLMAHACMAYRSKSSMIEANQEIEKSMVDTRKQMSPKIAVVINVFDNDLQKLKNTIKTIGEQELQFCEAIFCISSDLKPSEIISIINEFKFNFKWSIKQILDEYWLGSKSVNVAVQSSKSTYFALFDSGFLIPKTFVKEIDIAICDNMERFIILEGIDEKGNGCLYQTYAFNALRGNEEAFSEDSEEPAHTFIEKISYIAVKQGLIHLIKKCEEICPCMKSQ